MKPSTASSKSSWAPFRYGAFTVLWTATVISNVGTWMNDVGAGWLMTELSPSPFIISSVQAATTLPIFLFALLAGAIADIVDRRIFLLATNFCLFLVSACLAVLVTLGVMTPILLLMFTFLIGTGAAFVGPAWQAIVPALVPRDTLSGAIALNSMGVNVSRAIGPALAGFLIVAIGIWSPFALNAVSFLVILAALLWWSPPKSADHTLPAEHVFAAMRSGLRYTFNSPPLTATLKRSAAFFLFASAYWAMLPLIARDVLKGGPTLYGILLASIGVGAVSGALFLPSIRTQYGGNIVVAGGTVGTALVLGLFALAPNPYVAAFAAALAGASWIAVLSSLHVSAQTALPDWVRARGLAIFLTIFFGSMSGGSLIWGSVASLTSVPVALLIAAMGALIFIPVSWRAKLEQGANLDLSLSSHWPDPAMPQHGTGDAGPVMLQVTYAVTPDKEEDFRRLMSELSSSRKRNGGYRWSLMQDTDDGTAFVETWFEPSWTVHLRHHARISEAERSLQDQIKALQIDEAPPSIRHFLGPGSRTTHPQIPPHNKETTS